MTETMQGGYFNMSHWCEKFLMIEYDKLNCIEFVEHVLRKEFGREYCFPKTTENIYEQSKMIRENMKSFVKETLNPKDGDAVLMSGLRMLCHVGIFVLIGTRPHVLHSEGRIKTSALHSFTALPLQGYHVEGVYSWL